MIIRAHTMCLSDATHDHDFVCRLFLFGGTAMPYQGLEATTPNNNGRPIKIVLG